MGVNSLHSWKLKWELKWTLLRLLLFYPFTLSKLLSCTKCITSFFASFYNSLFYSLLYLNPSLFSVTVILPVGDDDMVKEMYAHQVACFLESFRQLVVIAAGTDVARRVVVA